MYWLEVEGGTHNLVNALPTLQEVYRGRTGKSKYIRFLREQPFMFQLVHAFQRIFYFLVNIGVPIIHRLLTYRQTKRFSIYNTD